MRPVRDVVRRSPLADQVHDPGHELAVRSRCGDAGGGQAQPAAGLQRLGVEVPDDFHVVADEAQRHDHDALDALAGEFLDGVVDVGFEPRHVRGAGPGLVDEGPRGARAALGLNPADDLGSGGQVLGHVGGVLLEAAGLVLGAAGGLGVAGRDGVGGEQDVHRRVGGAGCGEPGADVGQAGRGAFDERFDEARVVKVLTHLVHFQFSVQPGFGQRHADVLAVLAAAGVTGVGARGDHEDLAVPGVVHVLKRLRDVGVPVAVAPEDRQVDAPAGEFGLHGGLERAVLLVNRADAAVGAVVVRDLFEPLVRDAAAPGDVAEERDDVLLALRAAEGGQEDGVVLLGSHPAGLGDGVHCGHLGVERTHARTSTISAALTRRPV